MRCVSLFSAECTRRRHSFSLNTHCHHYLKHRKRRYSWLDRICVYVIAFAIATATDSACKLRKLNQRHYTLEVCERTIYYLQREKKRCLERRNGEKHEFPFMYVKIATTSGRVMNSCFYKLCVTITFLG